MHPLTEHVAVAISVYEQDKAANLKCALDSLLNQTYSLIDIYLQVDGYVSDEIHDVIGKYEKLDCFFIEFYSENVGLAFQLNRAICKIVCKNKYTYIARMDADDICLLDRIEKQVSFFKVNPSVAVLGTGVIEFDSCGNEFYKRLPVDHDTLDKHFIKRCPFNHPTVMFNLSVFDLHDLKYNDVLKNTQDYYLWTELLFRGYKFANIDECLLYFRIDENFHKRRGVKKSINDLSSRFYAMKKLNKTSLTNFFYTMLLFILRVSPSFFKSFVYKNLR